MVGAALTSAVQLTQNVLPLFAFTSPVPARATTVPNDSVAPDATVHVGIASTSMLIPATTVNSAQRASRRDSDRVARTPARSAKLRLLLTARRRT